MKRFLKSFKAIFLLLLKGTDGWYHGWYYARRLIFLGFFTLIFFQCLLIIGRTEDFEDYALFEGDFEQFILDNAPLVFMNPNADPFLCGNNGGPTSKCGHYVSEYAENWRVYKPWINWTECQILIIISTGKEKSSLSLFFLSS